MIELRQIREDNFSAVLDLDPAAENEDAVDTVAYSLAEAWLYFKEMLPRAIYADHQLIGFVSIYIGEGHYQIINFLIDQKFQNRGYGRAAAEACLDFLREDYQARRVSLPVHQTNIQAMRFWERLGFEASDNIEDGYLWLRKNISI